MPSNASSDGNRSPFCMPQPHDLIHSKAPRSKEEERDSPATARRYVEELGIGGHRAYGAHGFLTPRWPIGTRRREWWGHADHPFGPRTLASALAGRYSVDVEGLERCRVGVVDLDSGHVARDVAPPTADPAEDEANSIDAFLAVKEPRAARMRRLVADASGADVEALRGVVREDGAELHVVATPRGAHAFVLFDAEYPVAWVGNAMARLVERAGLAPKLGRPGGLEVFPRAGALCMLPLTGSRRLLSDDLCEIRNTRRAADLAEVFAGRKMRLVSAPDLAPDAPPTKAGRPMAPRPEQWAELGQQYGPMFCDQVLDLVEHLPLGCSYPAACKIAFACFVSAGMSADETLLVLRRVLDQPGHRCRAVATEAGKRELLAKARSHLRHLARGVDGGAFDPGRLRDGRLRETLTGILTSARREAKQAAAHARWAR